MDAIWKSALLLTVLLFVAHWFFYRLIDLGFGVKQLNHKPGPCRIVPGIECGSEQIATTSDGLAFITNGFKILTPCDKSKLDAKIYLFDFNNPHENITDLKIVSNSLTDLTLSSPHGLDVYEESGEGIIKLYVIFHTGPAESVEVFLFNRSEPSFLQHIDSIRDESFKDINDLTMISEDEFYITNLMSAWKHTHSIFAHLEYFLRMHTGNIVYYNKRDGGKVVQDGLSFANGIAMSGDLVFLAAYMNTSVIVYKRNKEDNSLSWIATHDTLYPIDNIFFEPATKRLYVGGTKHTYRAVLVVTDEGSNMASTFVARLTGLDEDFRQVEMDELFYDNGQILSAGSAANVYQKKMLIGTVYHKLMFCQLTV